jgi:PAS domain S-box-containing protein
LSEDRYRSVVDNSPIGIYRVAYDGRFITVNPALCAMTGYSAEELFAHGITMLYETAALRARLLNEYESRPTGKPIDVPWVRKDGSMIITRAWVYAERDERGAIAYLDGYVEDVTHLRDTEHALRQAEKLAAVGQLISGVAHELNNPLSAILLFAEELLCSERPDDETEALTIITQQARRSRGIVRDLLAFVRSREVVRAPICPDDLLRRIARTLEPQVNELGVRLHVSVSAVESIHVDQAGIEQVVTNLVMNAAQATGRDGNVWVHGFAEPGGYAIEVVDDGPGLPPHVLPKIFDPFFTTKPMGQGTGLGLSVSMGIVQQHGGTIVAENRDSRGRGARLLVRLPAPARAVAVEPAEDSSDSILVA